MAGNSASLTSTWKKLLLLAVAFTLQAVSLAPYYSFGQLFTALKEESGEASGSLALIGSLRDLTMCLGNVLAGALLRRYGHVRTLELGVVGLVLGMLLDSIAPSPWWLLLSYSLISGLAIALIVCPAATLLYGRVEGWQLPVAVGLASAGAGAGTMAVNSAMEVLLELGWRSTQRILAGAYAGLLIPCCLALRCLLKSEGTQTNQKQPKAWELKASFRPFLELKYALFSVCLLLYIATSMIPFTHLVFYARDELHYDNAAGLMSLTGLGSMVGRLSCGVLAVWIPARWIFPALFLLQGCVLLWLPFCEPWQLPSFSMIYGLSSGVRIALVTLVVAELFGAHRVQPLFCLLGIPMGFGLLAGPPLAGLVFDLSGSYQAAFFGSGAAMIALLPLLGLILFLHKNAAPGGPGPESADDQGVIDKPKDSQGPQENVLSC